MSLLDRIDRFLGTEHLPPREQLGFHLHPHVIQPGDVEACMALGSMIRMQAPGDYWREVVGIVEASPWSARFLLIVQPGVGDLEPTNISQLMLRLGRDKRVAGIQLGNECNSTANDSPGLSPGDYVRWAAGAANIIRRHDKLDRPLVAAATSSVIQGWPDTWEWNWDVIDAGLLDYVNHFALHHYGSEHYKLALVRDLVAYARSHGAEQVWLTETGLNTKRRRLRYIRRTLRAYRLAGIDLDRVFLYCWRGHDEYDLVDDGRVLQALKEGA